MGVIRAVDHQLTLMYWHIGKLIFEEEQEGKDRAEYGKKRKRNLRKAKLFPDTVFKEVFINGGLYNTRCTKVVQN